MNRPAFQFYPADWRKDIGLQTCSMEAKGLWIDLMCIMHESENYGFLEISVSKTNQKRIGIDSKTNQKRIGIDSKTIGKLVGLSSNKVSKLIAELEQNGVFSRDDEGVIFCRRMVKDEHIRNIRSEAGKKGGNPDLLKQQEQDLVKQNKKICLTSETKIAPPPSSSSSSSSSASASSPTPSGQSIKSAKPDDDDAEWWNQKPPAEVAKRMQSLQSQINQLHPSWKKRPHFSAKELHSLHENSSAWVAVEEEDWKLLTAFMFARIPDAWRRDPRDYFQPDNRLGLIGIGPSSILSTADKWAKECKRRNVPTGIENSKAQ